MPSEKLISVCINAYNSESTIKETLESVLSQTYGNLQVIVVDDCSTDNTVGIVEKIAAKDSRVKLYRLPENGNISNANNEALLHAEGDYIAHLDADDIWVPDKLEKQFDFLENNPEYGACFTHVEAVDETEEPLEGEALNFFNQLFNIENMSQAKLIRLFFETSNHLCHSSVLIRKSVQDEIGLHSLSLQYLHDFDLWARLIIKYPVYIIQEPLVKYLVRAGSNSDMDAAKTIAHNEEYARVVYNMTVNCPDDIFLEAFADKLKFSGEHTHGETEIEKAFVLLDGFIPLPQNSAMGLRRFDELFEDTECAALAEEKFGFGVHELYKLHRNKIYYDANERTLLDIDINTRKDRETRLRHEMNLLDEEKAGLSDTLMTVNAEKEKLQREYDRLLDRYNRLEDSFAGRMTKSSRERRDCKERIDYLSSKVFDDGSVAKAKVMLFGFFGHNLGDDMFFDILFNRYPDTMFTCSHTPDYTPFMAQYPNVRFIDVTEPYVNELISYGQKHGHENLFDETMYKTADAAIHLGGSVYQQIGDWKQDIEIRKKRHSYFKNFFCVSNNFGPYSTDKYKGFWIGEFLNFKDVCFRDIYSYGLFIELTNVRYAPDLLFTFQNDSEIKQEKRVSISVINPRFRVRNFSEDQANVYEIKLLELIHYYVHRDYYISLLSFCDLEEDRQEADKLISMLSPEVAERVSCKQYTYDYREITDEIAKSEIVIATRFHAMILGYVSGKKVLPICYGNKMTNVVNDLKLTNDVITLEELGNYSADELAAKANTLGADRIAQIRELADAQFLAFDGYIGSMGGTIIK